MNINISILKPFEKWFQSNKRLKIAYGGRGGGKSESIARLLIAKSFEIEGIILCAREIQKSISYSTYPLLISIIKELDIEKYFIIKKTEIINTITNCKFLFLGIRECFIDEIKSIYNIEICFIEEAQTLTQNSYEILEPSIRADSSEIWFAFNPRYETDFLYSFVSKFELKNMIYYDSKNNSYYYKEYEDNNILITFINFDGNYYFSDILNKSRLSTKELFPKMYSHIWLGEIKKSIGKIFIYSKLRFYDETIEQSNLKAVVDPAFGEQNCFTSVIVYKQIDEKIYLLDAGLIRNDYNSTTDESITNFLMQFDIKEIYCEGNFAQKELIKRLERNFIVNPFYVYKNKFERIYSSSYKIYERVYFPISWTIVPNGNNIDDWLKTPDGRGYIALRQLLNFSDITDNHNKKNDVFSYLDFPDALSSLVTFAVDDSILEEDDNDEFNISKILFGD